MKRALILDFGGVLTSNIREATLGFDRREGLPEGTFMTVVGQHPEGIELFAQLERGEIGQAEWGERTGALLGVDGTDLLPRVLADLRTEPSVAEAAQRARAAGVRLALLSNSSGLAPYDSYLGWDLEALFDVVVLSEHHGIAKPDPALYEITLQRLGLPGSECVFVDDTPRNLPPAEALGIATVLATDPAATIAQAEALLGLRLSAEV
ncbi:HAD-IA family hydrolase [Kitasatospora kifunensis]|uniref:Putative hydrolase of the HAD superfamily n=1 Tax=Kitasatospora kifunensis TaxID=58351 RepID=A0A7W7R6L7_KITKI|nr:HAD-IA family hydrolase [Kitasatospora kifunensis]MBB4926395.1 putative hydrolase of the HAD superfamily [Kitasatospora kifunensis]